MKTLARDGDVREILRRLRTLGPESVRRWGRMSAHQMVCHLNDAFRMANGEKPVYGVPSGRERTLVKWIALYVPLPWPSGIMTLPEIDQELCGTRPGDFAADLAELERRVETFAGWRDARHRPPHPIFGTLSEAAWLRWGYLHVDHHLRQFGR